MTILVLDYIFDRMQNNQNPGGSGLLPQAASRETMSIGAARRSSSSSSSNSGGRMGKRPGKKPGRKPSKIDEHAKLERSRQSARECRARKKLRYQYLEELVLNREKAVFALRDELETFKQWCLQLDQGGGVPEPLMKMIVNEDVNRKNRQMQAVSRSLQQHQQQQQLQQRLPSSSSSSSNSPPYVMSMAQQQQQPPQQQQQQQKHQQTQRWRQQQSHHQQQHLPVKMSTDNHDTFQSAHQQVFTTSAQSYISNLDHVTVSSANIKSAPRLRRQTAVDLPQIKPESIQSFAQSSSGFPVQQQRTTASDLTLSFPTHRPSQGMPSSKYMSKSTETPLKYEQSQDSLFSASFGSDIKPVMPSPAIRAAIASTSRGRSFSNPVTMVKKPLQDATSNVFVNPSTSINRSQLSAATQSYGMFSGDATSTSSTLSSLALPVGFDDGSSSDDNRNPTPPLFGANLQQKRTLSDTNLLAPQNVRSQFTSPKGMSLPLVSSSRSTTNQFTSASPSETTSLDSPMYDPHTKLSNLTTVYCFSNTRTSNTPSPAPYNLIPVGQRAGATPSPTPSSYQPSTTPSMTTTSPPGPLLSLNSFLELATSALPSAANELIMDDQQSDDPAVPNFLFSQQTPTAQCSTTGLSASIAEPIPEWYSFLADLQGGEMSSRHGASSGHCTPVALTPKPNEQPPTPESSSSTFLNVPNIIDEFLDKPFDT